MRLHYRFLLPTTGVTAVAAVVSFLAADTSICSRMASDLDERVADKLASVQAYQEDGRRAVPVARGAVQRDARGAAGPT